MSDSESGVSQNDIAIVGMALRVPGARSLDEFWTNLLQGVESMETRTPEQLIAAGEHPDRIRRKNYVPRTAELPGLEDFDAEFFGLSPKEAAIMDPQHRQFLECAWEALEHGTALPESTGDRVGVFAGCGMGSYFYFNVLSHRSLVDQVGLFLLRHTGNDKDFLATRASFLLNLKGPSVNVQTACSTSLVAVHYACQSLLSGECDMALAGGVTIELPHRVGYLHHEGEVLSPDGHCRAFDHRAAGTVFGSGVGVVVLRRLTDAIRDGDPIRGVIKGSAVNNDGGSKAGYLAPSVTGQAEAVVEALSIAGISADTIGYVECHGTGTYLGDPIEIEALTQAYRQSTSQKQYCRVGSVKTNIGHLDTAAGVVGLIKSALAIESGEIPPTLNFEKPNPAIDFAGSPFIVNDTRTPWPRTAAPRRAAVNSLGVGGTNAHVILEEAPIRRVRASKSEEKPQLIVLSAKSRKALDDAGKRLSAHLARNPDLDLADVAFTLREGRKLFDVRRVVAVANRADAIDVLARPDSRRMATHTPVDTKGDVVFLFPGGGAQYVGMARDLYMKEKLFRDAVDEGLGYLPAEAARELRRIWLDEQDDAASESSALLMKPSKQLPALLILEVALTRLWMSWGVTPQALIGHSMGENTAACIAGVMSFESAVNLVHLRGMLVDEITGGAMLSVPLPARDVEARLPGTLELAVVNAPELCVVTGKAADIEAFREVLLADGVDAVRIPIDAAGHSRLLDPILDRFEAFLRKMSLAAPRIPIISNLTGAVLKSEEAQDPRYWRRHFRSTVRFADGIAKLAEDPARIYIEVGPGRMLSSLVKAQGTINANQVINSLPHADEVVDDELHFLTALGRAWATGLSVPLERLYASAEPRRIDLPTYAFQHQSYFLDRIAASGVEEDATPVKRPDIASWGWLPTWRQTVADVRLGAEEQPASWLVFLDDGTVGQDLVDRLRRHGHTVATVTIEDAFGVRGPGDYVLCPEHGRDGYDALVKDLAANGDLPQHIVHLWLTTHDESFRPGSSFFHRNQERGFNSLFFLAQALSDAGRTDPLQITAVTNGMQRIGNEPLPYPDKATVLGPAQVLPREMPNVSVRVVDIPIDRASTFLARQRVRLARTILGDEAPEGQQNGVLDCLRDELLSPAGNEIVAYRNGRRWTRVYDPVTLDKASEGAAAFRERGVYLITGGLGALATATAEDLARRFEARLVLVGRTAMPDRSEWQSYLSAYGDKDRIGRAIAAIQRIEEAGGEVMIAHADITNSEAMRGVIEAAKARFGAIHGVLHTAGVVKDDLIPLKALSEIEEVFAPKVLGTLVLAEAIQNEALDFLVLYSSTSSDTAPAGQVDYVAANAFLNAFAESRVGSGTRTIAVHWGIWKDVGLAARAIAAAERNEDPPVIEAAHTPLFDRRVQGEKQEWLEAHVDSRRHWVLDEHRLGSGHAIWPGTGYLELIAEALVEQGVQGPYEVEDLTFLRPLYVPDGEARIVRVDLAPDGNDYRLSIDSEQAGGLLQHAEARVHTVPAVKPAVTDIAKILARCSEKTLTGDDEALRSAQEDHLRFGARWKVLRSAAFGRGEAMAKLALSQAFVPDVAEGYLLHPALLDIATGYAMDLIDGYDAAAALWVPMTYTRMRVYRPLPATVWSHVRLDPAKTRAADYATFDVTITDEQGGVLVEVQGFTVKRLPAGTDLVASLSASGDAKGAVAKGSSNNGAELSPALARLAAQVDQGILAEEGFEALLRAVGAGKPQVIVSSMDLLALQSAAARVEVTQVVSTAFERPDLGVEFVEPQTDYERTLAGFWSELLGVKQIGVHDSFFDLGGHSLIAVRLFRKIKAAYAVEFPISTLFEAPTIAQCAALIEQAAPKPAAPDADSQPSSATLTALDKPRLVHLVRMDSGKDRRRTPFFICAGMFGNILNLRHLAVQIGADRPVYGLQARGIYGGQEPHETFEEMARDNIAEVRTVQPHGPYLIGGFSGGGLVAYEMAQQLLADGEETALVVMLDTPYRDPVQLSIQDRIMMKMQDLNRDGIASIQTWVRNRLAWEQRRRRIRNGPAHKSAEQFHNEEIEAAFRRALGRYKGKPYGGPVVNARPKLDPTYRITGGRVLNNERDLLEADNGWSPLVADLSIREVPGDHDSMVLEPHVRVLTSYLRAELMNADRGVGIRQIAAE